MTFEALYAIASDDHGELAMARVFGTLAQSGGAVEVVYLRLGLWRGERLVGMELFEPGDLPQARARFEALRPAAGQPSPQTAPLRISPNAVTRAMRRFEVCAAARDWAALTDLHAPDFIYEDRRPLLRDSGNREKLVASVRLSVGAGARESHTVLATAGNRLALIEQRFRVVQRDVVVSELEMLLLIEVGADGRIVASITFAPDEREAADAELRARFEAASQ